MVPNYVHIGIILKNFSQYLNFGVFSRGYLCNEYVNIYFFSGSLLLLSLSPTLFTQWGGGGALDDYCNTQSIVKWAVKHNML